MTPWLDDGDVRLYHGDALEVLAGLPDGSVDCVVTSPPYWGLRDYGTSGQLGLEETPDEFVANMVAVFREIRRVLADQGTCWVNLGDSYIAQGGGGESRMIELGRPSPNAVHASRGKGQLSGKTGKGSAVGLAATSTQSEGSGEGNDPVTAAELKPKNLVGIPWRCAFALQADGWYLRSDIVWSKPNPMPESVTDRPTKAHEYVFMLTKQPRYWFDAEAVREPHTGPPPQNRTRAEDQSGTRRWHPNGKEQYHPAGRNVRSVWQIATQPYPEAHFATFPEELARRCILAGCPVRVCRVCGKPSERIVERPEAPSEIHDRRTTTLVGDGANDMRIHNVGGQRYQDWLNDNPAQTVGWSDCGHNNWRPGTVLDPFIGSGTVAKVARDHGRHAIGIDLSAEYLELAARRLQQLSLLT